MSPRSTTRRRILPLALGALALVAAALACTQSGTPLPGGVSGTYDLARVGRLVFVTSADKSELRVINARQDGGVNDSPPGDWVRAPNPLEALQIPVLERPVSLARDVTYSDQEVDDLVPLGGEVTGPYVYAFADGRPEISVVGADPQLLRELKRFTTDGPITAASAMGPGAAGPDSTLFYATLVFGTGNLYEVKLHPADQIKGQTPAPRLLARMDAGETITAIQALTSRQEVAVAVRAAHPPGTPATGRTFAISPSTGVARSLQFGAPVRLLATHPGFRDFADNGGVSVPVLRIPAEQNLFGVVDEESCGGAGSPQCTRILAVDVATGAPAIDFSGQPALPVPFLTGLPQSLTFVAGKEVQSGTAFDGGQFSSALGAANIPLMGLVTNTDGLLYFFEAVGRPVYGTEPESTVPEPRWTIRHLNQQTLTAAATGFFYENDGGTAQAYPTPQPPFGDCEDGGVGLIQCSVQLGKGTAVAETVRIFFEGVLPGLEGLPTTDGDGQGFPLPAGAPVDRVEIGDRIVAGVSGGGFCPDLTVTAKSASAIGTTDPIPPGCVNRTSFAIRAADPTPYVVIGTQNGYMGRLSDQMTKEFLGAPYYRYDPSVQDPTSFPPALKLRMGDRVPGIARDYQWVFQTQTTVVPLFFLLNTAQGFWPGFHLPYGVAQLPYANRAFVSYPSVRNAIDGSGAVIEFDPRYMAPNQPNAQISSAYR